MADYSADSLVSRATRVWLVQDESGKQYVLKDVWLDTDRPSEHEIRNNLLNDILDKHDRDTLSKHMLTPYAAERLTINGKDDTTDGMMGLKDAQKLSPSTAFDLVNLKPIDVRTQSVHPGDSTLQPLSGPPKRISVEAAKADVSDIVIRSKYHYRILFEEYGTDLYHETSLYNVFKTLTDLLNGAL